MVTVKTPNRRIVTVDATGVFGVIANMMLAPEIISRMAYPMSISTFNALNTLAGYQPTMNRFITIVRRPLFGPRQAMSPTGIDADMAAAKATISAS
jgi:hypothetical protein